MSGRGEMAYRSSAGRPTRRANVIGPVASTSRACQLINCKVRRPIKGRSVMRSAILIFVAILAFATTPARAQGEARMIRAVCDSKATPVANTDRLARRLNLADPQKAMLKDLTDASASAGASAKKSLCAEKTDLS